MALDIEYDTNRLLKRLSAPFQDSLLAIAGIQSVDLLGVDPSSCSNCSSMPFLALSHFPQRPVEFSLQHISNLPPWTTGRRNWKGSSGYSIAIERLAGPIYPQGDYKAVDPKDAMDFAVSAFLRDAVWFNDSPLLYPRNTFGTSYIWQKGATL